MKKLILFISIGFIWLTSTAQTVSFKVLNETTADTALPELRGKFGGISSIEPIPAGFLYDKNETTGKSNRIYIITSDHPRDTKQQIQLSYSFTFGMDYSARQPVGFFGLNNIESVRYNEKLDQLFFCYENDYASGVGMIRKENNVIKVDTIFTDSNYHENRGIEGISFSNDNRLWIANESGSKRLKGKYVPFYALAFNEQSMKYDTSSMIVYRYPFDKCVCLTDCGKFDGGFGSGVSEILAMKDQPGKLLVMERCFDGTIGHVRLFLASVEAGTDILSKELVFDCNDYFIPDNLEGMCWGKDKGEEKIVYLVSDNNYRAGQKNQVVKLQMIVKNK